MFQEGGGGETTEKFMFSILQQLSIFQWNNFAGFPELAAQLKWLFHEGKHNLKLPNSTPPRVPNIKSPRPEWKIFVNISLQKKCRVRNSPRARDDSWGKLNGRGFCSTETKWCLNFTLAAVSLSLSLYVPGRWPWPPSLGGRSRTRRSPTGLAEEKGRAGIVESYFVASPGTVMNV